MLKRFTIDEKSTHTRLFDIADLKENNAIGKLIQEERRSRKMSLERMKSVLFSYGIDVQKGAISKWELGDTSPNCYQMLAICDVFGIDDYVSYFTGKQELNSEGRKKVREYKADLIASGRYTPIVCDIKYVDMPVSRLAASAGTGYFLDEENFEKVSFPENSVPAGADFALHVSGDSMEPVYSDGQLVWVKKCTELRPGDVGIFILDDSGYIKMYSEAEPENPEDYTDSTGLVHRQPVLLSYNKKYDPIVIGPERSLHIVGKVL